MKLEGEMRVLSQQTTAPDEAKWNTTNKKFATVDGMYESNALKTANTVADAGLKNLGLTAFTDASGVKTYYKTLSTTQTINANNSGDGDSQAQGDTDGSANSSKAYSEVQSVQAGGYLAYAPADAEYTFVLNQTEKVKAVDTANKANAAKDDIIECAKDTRIVAVANSTGAYTSGAKFGTTAVTDSNATFIRSSADAALNNTRIDSESFKPLTQGLYLFRRNIDLDDTSTSADSKYEFSGYYFIPDGSNVYGSGTYYALNYLQSDASANPASYSDYTLSKTAADVLTLKYDQNADIGENLYSVTPTTNLALFTAKYTEVDNDALVWKYTAPTIDATSHAVTAPATLTASYAGLDGIYRTTGSGTSNDWADKSADDIDIVITLNNIYGTNAEATTTYGSTLAETWTAISNTNDTNAFKYYATDSATAQTVVGDDTVVFYYNNDLESGDTTAQLVDSVKLADTVTQKAFLAFDFDLNVLLDSVQVTLDEAGVESAIPVAKTGANGYKVGATDKSDGAGTWADTAANSGASVTAVTMDGSEISNLTWTATPTT